MLRGNIGAKLKEQEKEKLVDPSFSSEEIRMKNETFFIQFIKSVQLRDFNLMIEILKAFQNAPDQPELFPLPPLLYTVYQGGGVKGSAYIGANEVLEKAGYLNDLECVAGASAGAMNALFLALGFGSEHIKHILKNLNLLDFKDPKKHDWGFWGNFLGMGINIIQQGGCYTGEHIHCWASNLVEQVLGDKKATFETLAKKREHDPTLKNVIFKAMRCNPSKGQSPEQRFSCEDTPHVIIVHALCASIAYPGAFSPRKVHEIIIDSYGIKRERTFGTFSDGGAIDNFPMGEFNRDAYRDRYYPFVEKQGQHSKIQINPCSLGFSLVSNMQELEDDITPLSEELKKLKEEQPKEKEEPQKSEGNWTYVDLGRAALYGFNVIKVAESRDPKVMQQTSYRERTVQIYTRKVGTLDFGMSAETKKELIEEGVGATQRWFIKNRRADQWYESKLCDFRLSRSEEELREKDEESFFDKMARKYFLEFIREMHRQQKYNPDKNLLVIKNVRLRFFATRLNNLFQKNKKIVEDKKNEILKEAFEWAVIHFYTREELIEKIRRSRWELIVPEGVKNSIHDKLKNDFDAAILILKGQLSSVIPIVQRTNGTNLIGEIIATNDVKKVEEFFDVIKNALEQCSNQKRLEETVDCAFQRMLNEVAVPPVLITALTFETDEMLDFLLSKGADPMVGDFSNATQPIIESIRKGKFSAFKKMIHIVNQNIQKEESIFGKGIEEVSINGSSLLHHVLEYGSREFIKNLINDKEMLLLFKRFSVILPGSHGYSPVELAALLSQSEEDPHWELVFLVSHLYGYQKIKEATIKKKQEEKDFIVKLNKEIKNLKKKKDPTLVNGYEPLYCFQMLKSPLQNGMNQLSLLAKMPAQVDLLIALCRRVIRDRLLKKELLQLLNEKKLGKTPIFYASECGNSRFVNYALDVFEDSIEIKQAGPPGESSALSVAVKQADYETVHVLAGALSPIDLSKVEYVRSVPSWEAEGEALSTVRRDLRRTLTMIDSPRDSSQEKGTEKKDIARYGSGFANRTKSKPFSLTLFNLGRNQNTMLSKTTSETRFMSLHNIIKNNRKDIILKIITSGEEETPTQKLDDIFGWKDPDCYPEEIPKELVYAYQTNSEMYKLLMNNMSTTTKSQRIHKAIVHSVTPRKEEIISRAGGVSVPEGSFHSQGKELLSGFRISVGLSDSEDSSSPLIDETPRSPPRAAMNK